MFIFVNVIHETGETGGRRARIRAERSDEIVAAAWEIVRAEGIGALTTHALAARLDLAVGALYRYFPSKAAIVAELERRALVALGDALTGALARADGAFRGPGAPLRTAVSAGPRVRALRPRAVVGVRAPRPDAGRPAGAGAGAEAAAAPTEATLAILELAARAFAEAAEAGALSPGDAVERATLYGAGLRGALELTKLRTHAAEVDGGALADAMARALLAGFGADPEALARAFAAARRHDERTAQEASR